MSGLENWRHEFPNVAESEDFARRHPFMLLGYTLAVIVVYMIVFLPIYRSMNTSRFEGNLLYTGPGGALDNHMGSCRSDRDSGPYGGCGAAEAFAADPMRVKAYALRSQFAADTLALQHLTERSRFLGERAPDAVYALEQADADAMAAEVRAITGDDNEAAVIIGISDANSVAYKDSAYVAPVAAPAASRFAASGLHREGHLEAVLNGRA